MIICRTFVTIALILFVSMLLASPSTVSSQAEATQDEGVRRMTVWDTQNFTTVGSPRISPNDQWVLYTQSVRDWDDDELERTTHIWRVRVDGTDRRQLTFGESNSGSPAWFPDGSKIAFSSGRGKGDVSQVFSMYVDGGEAWQVTEHEGGVSQFSIAPDGEMILFTARDQLSEEQERRQKMRDDAEVVDERFQMTHLWRFDIESGKSKRLTGGDFTVSDPQWSPDSSRVAYVSRPTTKVDDSSWSDVWVVDLEGSAELFYENAGPDTSPRWAPDGDTLAMASKPEPGNTQWYSKLHLFPADGGAPTVMLNDFDLAFGQPMWSRDGRTIYWSTGQGTITNLFGVDLDSGELSTSRAPMRGSNSQWQLSHDGNFWVFSHSDPARPGNLWAAPREDDGFGPVVKLTDANPWVEEEDVQFGRVESIRWTNSDGGTIEGVLTYPVEFQEGTRYPLIVNPHGGPSGASMESFSSTNHMFAGNGFLVLQINFRGSSNYGQDHLNANQDNWGIRDYDDIMTGVDYVIERGWADPDRMVAYGWSYGGYMTFWMSTQTDRFKLISPGAGLSNLYSMYSTTDIPAYLGWFFGTPWDNEDIYRQLSPIRHANKVTAKVLIMHGANDARVPPEQAVEFYKALTDLGKDVSFVRYPRQGHGIGEPRLAMDRLRRYVCAFTDVLGMEATTEQCDGDVPMAGKEDVEKLDTNGMIEVAVTESAVDIELLEAEGLDCRIFERSCQLKGG